MGYLGSVLVLIWFKDNVDQNIFKNFSNPQEKKNDMIFKLPNKPSFNLNNQFFFFAHKFCAKYDK